MDDELDTELWKDAVLRRREHGGNRNDRCLPYRHTTDVENLINICSKKLEQDRNHQKALYTRASSYMKKGLYHEALADCERLIQLENTHVGAYYIHGCALDKLGDVDGGIQDFTIVLELDPNHVNAAYARGACQNRKGNYTQAIEDYSMALEKDQDRNPNISPSKLGSKVNNSLTNTVCSLTSIMQDQGLDDRSDHSILKNVSNT